MRRALPSVSLAAAALAATLAHCSEATTPTLPDAGPPRDAAYGDVSWDSGGPADAPAPPPGNCSAYCALVMRNCKEQDAQYANDAQCMAVCKTLPLGTTTELASNTVGCRQYHAGAPSATLPAVNCRAAGPFGGEKCGAGCSAFCTIAVGLCSASYASEPACISACAGYKLGTDAGASDAGPDAGKPTGDSLDCRGQYLLMAVENPEACRNVGLDSVNCR